MAENEKVGIVLTVIDNASKALKAVGRVGKKALEGVSAGAKAAGMALKTIGAAVVVVNQGLELLKKGYELFNLVIMDNIRAMIEYRGENDKISKDFQRMSDDMKKTKAIIADILTPVFLGLGDAINDTSNELVGYINANREMLATGIIDYLISVSRTLVDGVAKSFEIVTKTVNGVVKAFNFMKSILNAVFADILEAMARYVERMRDSLSMIPGLGKIRDMLSESAKMTRALGNEFLETSKKAAIANADIDESQRKTIDGINRLHSASQDFLGKAHVAVLDRIERGWTRVGDKINETTDALFNQRQAWAALEPTMASALQRQADLYQKSAMFLDQQMEAAKQAAIASANEIQNTVTPIAQDMAQTFGSLFAGIIQGTKTVGEAFVEMGKKTVDIVLTIVTRAIMAYAAEAAAAAAASQAGIPIIGPVLAGAAAAAMLSMVRGFIQAFAEGGEVKGGVRGKDSVPALLTPGEIVLTVEQADMFKRLSSGVGRRAASGGQMANGGQVAMAPPRMGPSIGKLELSINALSIPSEAQRKEILLGFGRDFDELVASGQMLSGIASR